MDDIAVRERDKYEAMYAWAAYGRPNRALALLDRYPGLLGSARTAVDLGCGNGAAVMWLRVRGIEAWGVDIAPNAVKSGPLEGVIIAPLWDFHLPAEPVDLGICCDVMEHIPEDKVPDTLARIASACRRTVFVIANYPERMGPLIVGEQLHCTLQPCEWWLEQMDQAGCRAEIIARDKTQREDCHYIIAGARP